MSRQLQATAYHEAGHAVLACMMGIDFQHVTIKPDTGLNARFAGHMDLGKRRTPRAVCPWNPDWDVVKARKYWGRHLQAILAGPLAETIHTRCWQQDEPQKGNDEYNAWVIADYFDPPAKAARWVNKVRYSTLETLRSPEVWAAVDAVARALVQSQTLFSADIHALVRATSD